MGSYTDLLFARPTFMSGVARILDFSGAIDTYNISPTPEEADLIALASDWYAVGEDIDRAILDRDQELRRQGLHVDRADS